jgi:hypothetical protein
MSLWLCPKCRMLTGPTCAPCSICGTPVERAVIDTTTTPTASAVTWTTASGLWTGCPCQLTTPCKPGCSCANPYLSTGCQRCATYGSYEQRKARAEWLAKVIDAQQS